MTSALALLAPLALAGASVDATFLLTLADVPVAALSVRLEGARYTYQSHQLLEEGARFSRSYTLDPAGPLPEVLALLRRPAPGCQDVLEERRGERELLCVTRRTPTTIRGSLSGTPFTATYQAGALERVELPGARWTRLAPGAPLPEAPMNPFADGFEVGPGEAVALRPALEGARVVGPVTGVGADGSVGRARCLLLARDYAASHPGAELTLGLVLEGGRAYPHAWVQVKGATLDPSVLPGADTLEARRYLALPTEAAGRAYLELLDGRRRVVGPHD